MKMREQKLEWCPVKRLNIFSTRIFDIQEITSRSPENNEKSFYTIQASDWVIIIPVLKDDNRTEHFLMVKQWRHGTEELSMEFPGGVIDPGETAEDAAKRELCEETGYRAGSLIQVASFSSNPAIMNNHCHIFLAENLENIHSSDLDDDEFLLAETIPVQQVIDTMGQGLYIHGLMAAALFIYIQKKGLPVPNKGIDNPI